jgi:hypothetical protein
MARADSHEPTVGQGSSRRQSARPATLLARSVCCQQTLCRTGAACERGAAARARLASRKLPSAPSCGPTPRAAGPAAGASPSAAAARAPSSLLTRRSIWRSVQATAVAAAPQHSQAAKATGARPCCPAAASGDLACGATHATIQDSTRAGNAWRRPGQPGHAVACWRCDLQSCEWQYLKTAPQPPL